ncbi:MAG: diguanylate cyclase [Solimonas sp.]
MNFPFMTAAATEDLRFVQRVYRLRLIGLGLGACAVAGAFAQLGTPPWIWALMLAHGLAWPHVAMLWARRSVNPQATEMRNLMIDSALGGAWIVQMHFMLLPSVLLATMLSMDKLAVGGWRFLARTAAAQLTCAAIAALASGLRIDLATSTAAVVACVPLLVVYPLAVSTATYALVRKVRRQNRQLSELSRGDALTGLLNRSSWEDAAGGEFERFRHGGPVAAMLMIDVDFFKNINDRHGHQAGDTVVRGIAAIVRDSLRSHDIAGRYGGDEFAVLLPGTALEPALRVAERIRQRILETSFDPQIMASCTVSIGAAELRRPMNDLRAWILQADAALYRAKTQGRNCVATIALAEPLAA